MEHFVVPHVDLVALGEPCSVVVMDNCRIHYSQPVFEMIREKEEFSFSFRKLHGKRVLQ